MREYVPDNRLTVVIGPDGGGKSHWADNYLGPYVSGTSLEPKRQDPGWVAYFDERYDMDLPPPPRDLRDYAARSVYALEGLIEWINTDAERLSVVSLTALKTVANTIVGHRDLDGVLALGSGPHLSNMFRALHPDYDHIFTQADVLYVGPECVSQTGLAAKCVMEMIRRRKSNSRYDPQDEEECQKQMVAQLLIRDHLRDLGCNVIDVYGNWVHQVAKPALGSV